MAIEIVDFPIKNGDFKPWHMIWVNYNDLTETEPWESWLVREIIPKWP